MNAFRFSLVVMVLGLGSVSAAELDPAEARREVARYEAEILPILKAKCQKCHNDTEQEGGVDLAVIGTIDKARGARKLWKRATSRVVADEMPPEDAPALTADEKAKLVNWLKVAGEFVDCDPKRLDPGPAPLRRLSRIEYIHTIRDLLFLPREAVEGLGLPEENQGDHFENQGALLSLAPSVMERYFLAADSLVDILFSDRWYAGGARQKLFQPRPNDKLPEREAAKQIITRLLRRAYRRPTLEEDVDRLLGFYDKVRSQGKPHDEGLRAILKPVLVSPRFLLRIEEDRPPTGDALGVPVDDHELAVRLSYFLWSTMPDDELFKVASSGQLSDPAILGEQISRLMKADQARTLTDRFALPWLQVHRLAKARPSQEFFHEFDGRMKQSMLEEVVQFMEHLRKEDRSVLELLDADYTFVNEPLAKLYKLSGVNSEKPQKVSLNPEDHRGGLLGMGAVLAVTSHTFRTAPTQRGKYVLEVLLGDPPPPPPMNAGVLADDMPTKKAEPTTFKQKLAAHATQPACAGCHRKIDPLGFALDNYNAIGAWRESTPDKPLDTAGELPGGVKVAGVADLKRVLLGRKDEFARAMSEKMLSYALGRELDSADECAVREIVSRLKNNDYKYSALIRAVVDSVPFRQRRRAD